MIIFKAQLLRASLSVGLKLKNENDTFFLFFCCVLRTKMNLAFSYCINKTKKIEWYSLCLCDLCDVNIWYEYSAGCLCGGSTKS